MKPRNKLVVALPLIAVLVIALVYLRLFESPIIILVVFALYVAVSLRNRGKFRKQREKG